jgi:hypothetical protein
VLVLVLMLRLLLWGWSTVGGALRCCDTWGRDT